MVCRLGSPVPWLWWCGLALVCVWCVGLVCRCRGCGGVVWCGACGWVVCGVLAWSPSAVVVVVWSGACVRVVCRLGLPVPWLWWCGVVWCLRVGGVRCVALVRRCHGCGGVVRCLWMGGVCCVGLVHRCRGCGGVVGGAGCVGLVPQCRGCGGVVWCLWVGSVRCVGLVRRCRGCGGVVRCLWVGGVCCVGLVRRYGGCGGVVWCLWVGGVWCAGLVRRCRGCGGVVWCVWVGAMWCVVCRLGSPVSWLWWCGVVCVGGCLVVCGVSAWFAGVVVVVVWCGACGWVACGVSACCCVAPHCAPRDLPTSASCRCVCFGFVPASMVCPSFVPLSFRRGRLVCVRGPCPARLRVCLGSSCLCGSGLWLVQWLSVCPCVLALLSGVLAFSPCALCARVCVAGLARSLSVLCASRVRCTRWPCCLAPSRVPWFCGRQRASLACLVAPLRCAVPRPVRALSVRQSVFSLPRCLTLPGAPLPWSVWAATRGTWRPAENRALGACRWPPAAGALGSLRVVPVRGPVVGLSLAGPSGFGLGLCALRRLCVCGPGHARV